MGKMEKPSKMGGMGNASIPEHEKRMLSDFDISIPELAEWNSINPPRVGFFVGNGHITKLLLRSLKLTKVPDSISDLRELTYLDLCGNLLSSLPESLRNLTDLKTLYLGPNNFRSLPNWLGDLKNLEFLELGYNKLSSLPESLGNLENLKELGLMNNNLQTLPKCLKSLKNLKILYLNGCNLHSLPEWLGNLTNLEILEIADNNLSILPESFRNLKKLGYINFENAGLRSFSNIPEEFIDRLDFPDVSWPWPDFTSKDNYPSKEAQEIIGGDLFKFQSYYRVSPLELAAKYVKDQTSLKSKEKDRLAWEGGHRERQLMEESGIKPNDLTLAKINKRLTITFDNGLKLIK